jgi:hypothetical protein
VPVTVITNKLETEWWELGMLGFELGSVPSRLGFVLDSVPSRLDSVLDLVPSKLGFKLD